MVMIWPLVMSWATPRPATSRISVATMGCMPTSETSTPFHIPKSVATASAPSITTGIGNLGTCAPESTSSPPMRVAATAAEMATTAPTEMSMPWVAITSVSPMAMIIRGDARFRMSTRLP